MKRIAKAIADAGFCSRRKAEELISSGKVSLNGEVIQSPAINVSSLDQISIDGQIMPEQEKLRVWIYHKPPGLITTHSDPQGRDTIFDKLPKNLPRVISVGRLDMNSQGLLLLTNSGEFARKMELPSSQIKRIYHVRCFGKISLDKLKQAEKGIDINGEKFAPHKIELIKSSKHNHMLEFTLMEGKNREIRKICTYFGLKISKLMRISYGGYKLGNLQEGTVLEVTPNHI